MTLLLAFAAMKLLIVATNVGGVNEVVEDGVSSLVADFGNVEYFGRKIIELSNNENLCRKMGEAARIRIAEKFDIKGIAEKYVKVFQLVAAGHRNGREIQEQIDGQF